MARVIVVIAVAGALLSRYLEVFDVIGAVVVGGHLKLRLASCTTHGVSIATTAHTAPSAPSASAPNPASSSKPVHCAAVASSSCAAKFARQPESTAKGTSSFTAGNCCTTAKTLSAVATGVARRIVVVVEVAAAIVGSVEAVVVVRTSFVGADQ